MLEEEKNLKDPEGKSLTSYGAGTPVLSYSKSNKLVTALFMVTDIMDKDEPLRNKLRTLGSGVISDIHSDPTKLRVRIGEILSFLDVAQSINLISEMNASILKNEFFKLLESVKEYSKVKSTWMEEFLINSADESEPDDKKYSELITRRHVGTSRTPTRLGVQKGDTLLRAIKNMSDKKHPIPNSQVPSFDVLKKHRRADIVTILNMAGGGLTITDIKDKAKGQPEKFSALATCGEKTLQRELVAMVKDGVLKKEGEKRWSRYSIL